MGKYSAKNQRELQAESYVRSVPTMQGLRATLLLALALAAYLFIPLVAGGRLLVPSVPTVAMMPILFLLVRKDLTTTDVLFLPKVVFVLLLSIALSPGHVYLTEKLLSLVQGSLAIAVTVMTVRLMLQLRLDVLERTLLTLWCLLLVGSVLEVAGLTRSASDAFRAWAFGGTYTLYDGDLRDVSFVGWIRPKVFATEPSAVSKMFIVAINAWLLVRITPTKAAVVAAGTAAMFVIMGSPMFVVSAALTVAILIWDRATSTRVKVATIVATLLVSTVFVLSFGETAFSTLENRVDRIGTTRSDGEMEIRSENMRAVIPWLALAHTWSRWPIFGVGFGGKEVVGEARDTGSGNYRHSMGANAAAEVWTYLGLLGGVWFLWLLLKEASHTGAQRLGLLLVMIFLFSQLMGSLDSFRYWGHVAVLWGALSVADSKSSPRKLPRQAHSS